MLSVRLVVSLLLCDQLSALQHQAFLQKRKDGPPAPYDYDTMISWLDQGAHSDGLKLPPKHEWFDVDGAMAGEKASWFSQIPDDRKEKVKAAARRVNRWHFMKHILETGDETTQASLPLHLLVMSLLEPDISKPGAVVLDAGSGTGFLVSAFQHLAGKGAEVMGMDCPIFAAEANSLITRAESVENEAPGPLPKILDGDLLHLGAAGEMADVINVGVAVGANDEVSPSLTQIAKLLKPGGALIAPVTEGKDKCADGRCETLLTLFRKQKDGKLVQQGEGQKTKFVQAGSCSAV